MTRRRRSSRFSFQLPALVAGLFAAGSLVSLSACSAGRQNDLEALRVSVEAYNHAYRWQNYEAASAYLPNDLRAMFLATYDEETPSLQVESYNILAVDVESERSALVRVLVRYTLLPSVTVEKRVLNQHWHKVGHAWILETEENSLRSLDPEALAPIQRRDSASPAEEPAK